MALPPVDDAFYPTPDEALAIALTAVRYAYDKNGVEVSVVEGSELYERFKALTDLVSIAINNNRLALADVSPLDATGDALEEFAGTYGVTKRPAASAAGTVIVGVAGSGSVTIPANFIGTSPFGIQVKTVSAYTVSDGGGVQVIAVSAGADTEIEEDELITWDSAAIGSLDQAATVGAGGITGGADEDSEETLRARLLRRLRDPGIGGNAAFVSATAESASAAIERAFVYQAARGPSSYDVAICRATGDRVLSSYVTGLAATAILSEMPGSENLNATSVVEEAVDVIIDLSLPLPVNAGGAGGGWRDAAPWPSDADTAYAKILDVIPGTNQIEVDSTVADLPVVGKRFGIWNYNDEVMVEFTIVAVGTSGSGNPMITVDGTLGSSLSFAEAGMRCSAGAINLTQYAEEFAAAVRALGPGEKTSNPDKLPRAYRYPSPDVEYPQALTVIQLNAVIANHLEVLNMVYTQRYATGTTNTLTSPTVATIEADPPNILTLKHLSFRRAT